MLVLLHVQPASEYTTFRLQSKVLGSTLLTVKDGPVVAKHSLTSVALVKMLNQSKGGVASARRFYHHCPGFV